MENSQQLQAIILGMHIFCKFRWSANLTIVSYKAVSYKKYVRLPSSFLWKKKKNNIGSDETNQYFIK